MQISPLTKWQKTAIVAITILSLFLHLAYISYPASPVFDEFHFATYSANYANRVPTFDIHPPLRKAVLGGIISLFPEQTYKNSSFLEIISDQSTGKIDFKLNKDKDFGDFPYVPLRVFVALFGSFTPLLIFELIRRITGNATGGLLAATFVLLDNALIANTRFILLDGIYIFLGLASLVLFFSKKPRYAWGGILFGLAVSIKLTAVVFLGPVIAMELLNSDWKKKKIKIRNFAVFILTGLAVFSVLFAGVNGILIKPKDRVELYDSLSVPLIGNISPPDITRLSNAQLTAEATLLDLEVMLEGYTTGVGPHPDESNWYMWPIGQKPIKMFTDGDRAITLRGNVFIWLLSTLAVLATPFFIYKERKRKARTKPAIILLGGYLFAMLPFVTIVKRTTFIYHYFPALLFAIGLAGYLITSLLEGKPEIWRRIVFGAIIALSTICFIVTTPYTYGLLPLW